MKRRTKRLVWISAAVAAVAIFFARRRAAPAATVGTTTPPSADWVGIPYSHDAQGNVVAQ